MRVKFYFIPPAQSSYLKGYMPFYFLISTCDGRVVTVFQFFFNRLGISSLSITENLLEMQIIGPYSASTELETLDIRSRNLCFPKSSRWFSFSSLIMQLLNLLDTQPSTFPSLLLQLCVCDSMRQLYSQLNMSGEVSDVIWESQKCNG